MFLEFLRADPKPQSLRTAGISKPFVLEPDLSAKPVTGQRHNALPRDSQLMLAVCTLWAIASALGLSTKLLLLCLHFFVLSWHNLWALSDHHTDVECPQVASAQHSTAIHLLLQWSSFDSWTQHTPKW